MTSQSEKAGRFLELHRPGNPLLLPNPWDQGSARVLASLGFQALATTSSGFAMTLGRLDGSVTRDEALAHAAAIVAATDLPVSADLENCFAGDPAGVARTVVLAGEAGLAGCSIEDFSGESIYDLGPAAERVAAAAEAAHAGPARLVLTARAENYLHGRPDLADTIARLQAYQAAGADVLYAPGLTSLADIRQVVTAVDRPVNVLAFAGAPSVAELAEAGVSRVSVGGAFAYAALGALADAATELRDKGTYGYLADSAIGRKAIEDAVLSLYSDNSPTRSRRVLERAALLAYRRKCRRVILSAMGVKVLQGWHSDPFELHGERYFSAGQPTKLVRDGYLESYDEPPSDQDEVAVAMTRFTAKAEAPPPGAMPAGASPRRGAHQDELPYRPDPRDRVPPALGFAATGIIVAAAVAVGVVIALPALRHSSKPAGTPGASDVAFVRLAAQRTMQQRTADMAISGAFGIDGKTVTMQGTSAFDIDGKAGTTDFTMDIPSEGVLTERIIQVNNVSYVSVSIPGQNSMPSGKTWISEPISSSGSTGSDASFSGDVLNALATLEKQGITVQNLGQRVIGNVNCTGYSVTPPDSGGETGTITVWIDSQHLVREFSMNVVPDTMLNGVDIGASPTSGSSGSISASVNMKMDFSYSALPLHVTAPPASSTVSLGEYLNQLGQTAKTSTS